jgi:hypothetical protein
MQGKAYSIKDSMDECISLDLLLEHHVDSGHLAHHLLPPQSELQTPSPHPQHVDQGLSLQKLLLLRISDTNFLVYTFDVCVIGQLPQRGAALCRSLLQKVAGQMLVDVGEVILRLASSKLGRGVVW